MFNLKKNEFNHDTEHNKRTSNPLKKKFDRTNLLPGLQSLINSCASPFQSQNPLRMERERGPDME
jgi:hypothetical protein